MDAAAANSASRSFRPSPDASSGNAMDWFSAPDYRIARLVLERGLGLIYLIAFLVAVNQFPALLGEQGLLPAPRYLARVGFRHAPSLFHLHYTDRFFRVVAGL